MFWITANNKQSSLAPDDFTLLANFLNRWMYLHFPLKVILPRFSSYGLNSTVTRSHGRILILYILNLPAKWHKISGPSSNFTLKLALGSASVTWPVFFKSLLSIAIKKAI